VAAAAALRPDHSSREGPIPDHFSGVAEAYAQYRPHYPASLFEVLATLTPGHDLAWDVGAGNGQASVPLAECFDRVLATDISARQLANAVPHPRVEYRAAAAESSGLPDGSVDLVTVAQAAHWFNLLTFYQEVERVLAPGGALVLWTYGNPRINGQPVQDAFHRWSTAVVGPYWPVERHWVDEAYQTLPFPFAEITPPRLELTADWNLRELLGYLDTWSSVSQYRKIRNRDPVPEAAAALAEVWGAEEDRRMIRWPLGMRIGYVRPAGEPPLD
jgi:SAM-dependent methyltransferase